MRAHEHDSTKDDRRGVEGQRSSASRAGQQVPAGLLALQRSVGNAAVTAMVQRADSIADRVGQRNRAARAYSPRLREQAEGGRGQTRYTEARERGIWDGNSRFSYLPGVQDDLFNPLLDTSTGLYACPDCGQQVPRYNPAAPGTNGMTVEHRIPYRQWIRDHAEPDENGNITTEAASRAYSDMSNLRALCRDCNSSLGGDQNTFV